MPDFNASQLLVPGAEKTDLVSTTIIVDGKPLPDNVMLHALQVTRGANRIPYAVLTFLDGDVAKQEFPVSDQNLLSPGNSIEIKAGYHGNSDLIFKGIIIRHAVQISQHEGPRIEIECKDDSVKLTAGRKNKYFFNQSDSDILESVLQQRGIKKKVDKTSKSHERMVQYNATDWDFINMRAEANGMLVLARDGEVHIRKPDFTQQPKITLTYGVNIYELEAEMDARDQYPTVKASVWDPDNQAVEESQPGGGGLGGGLASKASSTLSSVGSAVGMNLPGQKPNTDYSKVLGLDHLPLQHTGALSQEEAQQWAGAQMTKSQLAKSRGRVTIQGTAGVYPGDTVQLNGVGLRHSGTVYVTGVMHDFFEGMWRTNLQFGLSQRWFAQEFDNVAEEQAAALLPAIHGLQIGVVTALAGDPENAHRIQVRLPLIDNRGNGIWVRIACQDAGNNHGAFWRPEINQEVVVGFLNDDPREAVVLGMLNSQANPTPLKDTDTNHVKGWITRSDMRMLWDDDKKSLNITTPKGKKVIIDEQADTISLEDEHRNKIVLDKSGIVVEASADLTLKAAKNLNIEAPNVSIKAQASLKAEASGQAEVKSSGMMTIKGATVMIN